MNRTSAASRAGQLLAIVPWVASRDGPTIDAICDRFDVERDQLLADLELLSMVGIAPYTPDLLVEVIIDGDRVWIQLPQAFDRPLRLSVDEALELLVAARGFSSLSSDDAPIARALDKLARALGSSAVDAVAVDLEPTDCAVLELLRDAIDRRQAIDLDYYTYSRDERSSRNVEPHQLRFVDGHWYLAAHCRSVDDERVFRVDRIAGAELLDERFAKPDMPGDARPFGQGPVGTSVRLELDPSARWVTEYHPIERLVERPDGTLEVDMVITATPWLERLLVTLGPAARVIGSPEVTSIGREAARRILARYDVG